MHRQGIPNSNESIYLENWTSNNCLEFDKNQIDDFVHFFLLPLSSMSVEVDQKITDKVKIKEFNLQRK